MTETASTSAILDDGRPVPDGKTAQLPGDGAMWVMVLGDLVIFGGYFLIYMVHRAIAPNAFLAAQQHLNVTIGVVDTLVLLTSSLLVARSVLPRAAGDRSWRSNSPTPAARSACCSSPTRPTNGRWNSAKG